MEETTIIQDEDAEDKVNKRDDGQAHKRNVRALVYGAVCLAMSIVLARVMPVYRMPNGGSITLASLAPLFLYAYIFGFKYGLIVAIAYTAVITTTAPGHQLINPGQVILDYIIPYMALVVVALVPKVLNRSGKGGRLMEVGIYTGLGLFALIRWASQTASGVLFWYAPFGFSLLYNSVGVIDAAIAAIVLVALFRSRAFVRELEKINGSQISTSTRKKFEFRLNAKTIFLMFVWVAFMFAMVFTSTQFLRNMDARIAEVNRQRELLITLRLTPQEVRERMADLEQDVRIVEEEIASREQLLDTATGDKKEAILRQIADRQRLIGEYTVPAPTDDDPYRTMVGSGLRGEIEAYRRMIPEIEARLERMATDYATLPDLRARERELNTLIRNSSGTERSVWRSELEDIEAEIRRIERAHDRARQERGLNDARASRNQTVGAHLSLNAFLLLASIGFTIVIEKKDNKEIKKKEVY
ncbi:MAG: energy-coupled thiamine transporter ThiT [Firmicutes bacterium]|nr:energy-coupled thiamine transporter ThiT [Bacillota bacterium]